MNTYTKEIGEQLNNLLEKTYITQKGFKISAINVDNRTLKSYFKLKAQERQDFGFELKSEFQLYNYPIRAPKDIDDVKKAWMDVEAILSLKDEESMLEEAIKGEKAAVEEYNLILKNTELPLSTKIVVESQKNKIESGLSRFRTLEELC